MSVKVEVQLYLFLVLALDGGGGFVNATPQPPLPWEGDMLRVVEDISCWS